MKPSPTPKVPGKTEFERFDNAFRKVLTVSKEDLLKAESKWKRDREKKKRAKKRPEFQPVTQHKSYL